MLDKIIIFLYVTSISLFIMRKRLSLWPPLSI